MQRESCLYQGISGLKFDEVKVSAFEPASIVDAPRPDKFRVPLVAVRLSAPLVSVNPLDAVRSPALVIAPVPVVEMSPLVESTPSSVMVNLLTPPD